MLARRPLLVVLLLTVFTTIVFVARYGDSDQVKKVADESWDRFNDKINSNKGKGPVASACEEDLSWLAPYKFTSTIKYVSRDIITKPGAKDRPLVTKIDEPLFGKSELVDTTISIKASLKSCLPPLTLEVPRGIPAVPDASNMIFALQTTIGRLRDTVVHLERWLPHTGARLFCIVKENGETLAKKEEMEALEKEFHAKGMNVTIIPPVNEEDRFEQRYFSLVKVLYAARDERTEWMILIDDDTFFPSLHLYQEELLHHDFTKPQYIGALSEDWWAVNHYGLMGFGGASIILSVPMVKIMDDHYHDCVDAPSTSSGDVTVMDCVYRFSSVKLTNIPELYQLDLKNDASGFYESGRPVLSIHHWKEGLKKLELEKTHLVAEVCDDCFLQRWQFQDELILSNGYSIQTYPQGHLVGKKGGVLNTGVGVGKDAVADKIEKLDLLKMEETWDDNINVVHSLAPIRARLPSEAKVQYKILDSVVVVMGGKQAVRQVYVKRGGDGESDEVMVLTWVPGDEDAAAKQNAKASLTD